MGTDSISCVGPTLSTPQQTNSQTRPVRTRREWKLCQ